MSRQNGTSIIEVQFDEKELPSLIRSGMEEGTSIMDDGSSIWYEGGRVGAENFNSLEDRTCNLEVQFDKKLERTSIPDL